MEHQLQPTDSHRNILYLIGLYMSHWSAFELALDCATTKVMSVDPAKVIATTGGKSIADKITFLEGQLVATGHPLRSLAPTLASLVKANSIRNSIVHSYHEYGNSDGVTFIHRKTASRSLVLKYTTQEFLAHLKDVSGLAHAFSQAFAETEAEGRAFIEAAKQ